MSQWIFLSKNDQDQYINMFAQGCGTSPTLIDDFDYNAGREPLVLRGILKHKIIKQCWADGRTFYYMDTGYFGNDPQSPGNPQGWKHWHRIVRNDLQHGAIVPRPGDRFDQFNKKFQPWKKTGRAILVATPDEKPCKFYGVELDQWLQQTIETIKKHTDRPIIVRSRPAHRMERKATDTLQTALARDVFALVTFNSVAAIESVFAGIPAFTLAPTNAASPVCLQDLSQIESPYYADSDKLYAWACHLAYGQFHIDELKSGQAQRMLENQE